MLNLVYNVATRLFLRAETLEELRFAYLLTIASDAISVLGGLLGLAVIRRTTARQEARARRLRSDIVAPPA